MTFTHQASDAFTVTLRLKDKNGTVREEVFQYTRVKR
jgi:hypothetical protein